MNSDVTTPGLADDGSNSSAAAARRAELLASIARLTGMSQVEKLQDYLRGLPRPAVARCPYTGSVVQHSVDTGGIDGPWWNYAFPIRPMEQLSPTFFAFTGALRLVDPIPNVASLVKPGPEAPFVVPRLLAAPRMRAVLSSIAVGDCAGWTITYFTDTPVAIERFNDWGSCRYWVDGLGIKWDSMTEDAEPLDFDLAPWIQRGALQWIAPGDPELVLRSTPDGCPYLGLPGRHTFVRVQDGTVWELDGPSPGAQPRGSRGATAKLVPVSMAPPPPAVRG